jgi:hypothetical protein
MPDTPVTTTAPPAPGPRPSAPQNPRVPPDDNKIPGYADMSFEQRRFAQDQKRAQRGR